MKAFISYSHQDSPMLDSLHKHLAQLQRDNVISTWTDRDIAAGANLNDNISAALSNSQLFLALLSPDYIASNYCYEKEFATAIKMEAERKIVIIPIILEPCDWHNTPFQNLKALPNDGKAISLWENKNTAFLDVIQNLRKIIGLGSIFEKTSSKLAEDIPSLSRNYKVKKDFDSIQKLEFIEKSFADLRGYLKRYIQEIEQLDNIKARVLMDSEKIFECMLVNRNKIDAESQLKVSMDQINNKSIMFLTGSNSNMLGYTITRNNARSSEKGFLLQFDDFHLFWTEDGFYSNSRNLKELDSKEISNLIWNEWLESVGIM